MAAKKFLSLIAGRLKEVVAVVVSAGGANDGDLVALDAAGKLDASVLPSGIGANTIPAIASENLAAGDLVNVYDNGGVATVRKADATTEGKEANGFVKASVSSAATATVYLPGSTIPALTGLTAGVRMFLSTTAGALTATPPSATGNVVQLVGVVGNSTTLIFEPEEPVTLA